MAILIPARGEPRSVSPANGRSFTLQELQRYVGGYIEILRTEFVIQDNKEPLVAFLNEDGKGLGLSRNGYASAMFHKSLGPGDYIVGDVVLCTATEAGERDEDDVENFRTLRLPISVVRTSGNPWERLTRLRLSRFATIAPSPHRPF